MIDHGGTNLESTQKPRTSRLAAALIAVAVIGLLTGGIIGYAVSNLAISTQMNDLEDNLSELQNYVSSLQPSSGNTTYENATYFLDGNVSLSQLYDHVSNSVVLVQGIIVQYDIFG